MARKSSHSLRVLLLAFLFLLIFSEVTSREVPETAEEVQASDIKTENLKKGAHPDEGRDCKRYGCCLYVPRFGYCLRCCSGPPAASEPFEAGAGDESHN